MMDQVQLEQFLRLVDRDFPVPLSQKQDLKEYSKKLLEKATLCFVCEDGKILSLVAGYTENLSENMAFITLVATREEARGRGLAKELVQEFISLCREKNIKAVHLYAVPTNVSAVKMYHKVGFREFYPVNEPRPEDTHLIYYLEDNGR